MPAKTKKELEGERTRAQILKAAMGLFGEKGYRATSVAQIARACGISTATIFWHFRSKEGLLEAIFKQMFQELQQIMATKRSEQSEHERRPAGLPVLTAAEFDYFTEHSDRMRMLLGVALDAKGPGGKFPELLRSLLRSYVDLLSRQLYNGFPELSQGEARERATIFVSTLAGTIVLKMADAAGTDAGSMVKLATRFLLESPTSGSGSEENSR